MIGHILQACRGGYRKNRYQNCKYLSSEQSGSRELANQNEEEDFNEYNIHALRANDPYVINLEVNSKTITFEIDTGTGLTIVSQDTYERLLSIFFSLCIFSEVRNIPERIILISTTGLR